MAKKSSKRGGDHDEKRGDSLPRLKDETRYALIAVALFAVGVLLTLAYFEQGGRAGTLVYRSFNALLGAGYLLLPALSIALAALFVKNGKPQFPIGKVVSALVILIAALGLIDLLVGAEVSGLVGHAVGSGLFSLFDLYASVALLGAALIAGTLVLLDTHLSPELRLWGINLRKRENDDEVTLITGAATLPTVQLTHADTTPVEPRIHNGTELSAAPSNPEDALFSSIRKRTRSASGSYVPPPLDLLEGDSGKPGVGDIKAQANSIKRTLANFGIVVEMDEISIGPSVTRYALKPAEGVKLSRIVALQNDLSLALAAHPLRIEAPIPGKSLVGIEIPNTTRTRVGMASLIGAPEFQNSEYPLLVALGRAIAGTPHFANIDRAPHLLVAGTTGSGKSVMIHAIIISLLYRNGPENLRFIMVDPKRVELTLYNAIPHLLSPVITDPKRAIMALKWAAKEMERRYNLLEQSAVRDIGSYHREVVDPAYQKSGASDEELPDRMPYIVIIIDELADMMSTYPREMEAAIVRLAQMSRAVGIHLLLSTQRPSVEVITGLIKANIPSRVALQVASQIDSRTIIDMPGAEKLLGSGDLLYLSGDMAKPVRLQSAYISESEVKRVVKHLREHYREEIPVDVMGSSTETTPAGGSAWQDTFGDDGGDDDELYEEARALVIEARKASASYLQRRLKVGYARAARLLDLLEERGVIGPGDGAKPREVFGATPSETPMEEGTP